MEGQKLLECVGRLPDTVIYEIFKNLGFQNLPIGVVYATEI